MMSGTYDVGRSSLYNIKDLNSSFAVGSLKVMYLGENRNGTYFTKDAVQKALPSLYNVPIVCHWDDINGTIGGHDVTAVKDANTGELRLKNLTEPCGVVPEGAKFSFINDIDDDGVEHEYLVVDGVILWKRQDVFRHISEDLNGVVNHSMEISVVEFKVNDSTVGANGLLEIIDFEFTALCLLEDCEPCFQGSQLELYAAQQFKIKMEQMLQELKESVVEVDASKKNYHIGTYALLKGGAEAMNKENEVFDNKEQNDDKSVSETIHDDSSVNVETTPKQIDGNNNFSLTTDVTKEIIRALKQFKIHDAWGASTCCAYEYVDADFELCEVYCWDTTDWLLYGMKYQVNGDAVIIDASSKCRKKYAIVDFDGEEQPSPFNQTFTKLNDQLSRLHEVQSELEATKSSLESLENENNKLKEFKRTLEHNAIFAKFEDLSEIDAFKELKNNSDMYDNNTLEEKCFALRGRYSTAINFNLDHANPILKVENREEPIEPYGSVFKEFGNRK